MNSDILQEETAEERGKCQICEIPSSKCCSACSGAYYCSSEHQQLDWKIHKKGCKSYVLRKNDEIGRHYVAARNISAGVLVLKEIPVVSAPIEDYYNENALIAMKLLHCMGCNRCLGMPGDGNARYCSKCRFPVCSDTCAKLALHASNECEIYQPVMMPHTRICFKQLCVLRTCLLKKKNPKAWETLMTFQQSEAKTGKSIEWSTDAAAQVVNIYRISHFLTPEDWQKAQNVVHINKIVTVKRFQLPDNSMYISRWQYICLEATMFAHSCVPNCHIDCRPAPNMQMYIRAATDVKKGEMLTIDYNEANEENWFMATYMRHRQEKKFVCRCLRCVDPSEMGSNLSTFVCEDCKSPEMKPLNPLEETSDWKCGRCGSVTEGSSKIALMDELFQEIYRMKVNKVVKKTVMDLISKYSGNVLHPNNWVLVKAHLKLEEFLIETFATLVSKGSDNSILGEDYEDFVSCMQYLKEVATLVQPGINFRRANFCRQLAMFLFKKAATDYRTNKINITECRKLLDQVTENYTEALKFYKTYICTIDGRKSPKVIQIETALEQTKEMYKG